MRCELCGDSISLETGLDHLRRKHPDVYADGQERSPDESVE